MSYNNDEQARRAQAAQNAQWASNSRQPQNAYPYQTGTFSNPDEPIIHTVEEPSMNLLNSPSSHSIPGLPHNPAPLPRRYQNPARQQDLRRKALENQTYSQEQSSRGPPNAGYSAQPSSYYGKAPQDPRRGPSGSSREPPNAGYGAQPPSYHGEAPPNPRSGPSSSSQGYPGVGSSAQPSNYYPQAPPDSRPGPSGSQAAQTRRLGSMSNPIIHEGPSANELMLERRKKDREERIANGICPQASCRNRAAPGKTTCEEHLGANRKSGSKRREKKREEGICYRTGCDEPAMVRGGKCQDCTDLAHDRYEARK